MKVLVIAGLMTAGLGCATVPSAPPKRTVAVLLFQESIGPDKAVMNDSERCENTFIDAWGTDSATFLDVRVLAARQTDKEFAGTLSTDQQLRTLAIESGADLVIVGSASSVIEGSLSDLIAPDTGTRAPPMIACQATTSVRVLDPKTGIVLTTGQSQGRSMHIVGAKCRHQALSKALATLAADLKGHLASAR